MKTPPVTTFIIFLIVIASDPIASQTLPDGFTTVQVATGLLKPTGMVFAPDGRIFVLEQRGTIRVIKDGVLLPSPMIQLKVDTRGEGGLIGIALDPNFSTNHYIYLYYSLPDRTRNRISRFTCNGDVASLSTEQIILNLDTRTASVHHGGAMHFKDGKLYVATGDDSNGANAQNLDLYHGKILRINPDGSIPSGNPYTSGSEKRKRIWAHGVRNPFTFSIQPGGGKIFVNDVGLQKWEEINDISLPGKNYGWPEAEGNSTNPAFENPVYAYEHGRLDEFGCAITGGTFFNPGQTTYPAGYYGKYFFQDFCAQWIKVLDLSTSPARVEPFATGAGADALYLTTGSDGNLYYLTRSTGSLYKIIYTSEEAPKILTHPTSVSVSMGEPASFSVTASGKSPLNYQWRKNGTNIAGATSTSFTIPQTMAAHAGSYSVRVSNGLGNVVSNAAQLTITAANDRPIAQILQPAPGSLYRAGDIISFSGTATDSEDGDLAAAKFTWMADFHHDTHRHDGPPVASGSKSGSFTIPTRGETADDVWYRLYLIVTDSQGSADTASLDIHPRKSTINLATQPTGLKVELDGQPLDAPLAVLSVENIERTIGTVSPQQFNGKTYTFQKWLHGGAETQTIFTPVDDVTYTAVFTETMANGVKREVWNGIGGASIASIPFNSPPDQITELTDFEGPTNAGDSYGSRVRAYISPPVTGNYVFWISGNDRTELWLSMDGSPANKRKIAYTDGYTYVREWTRYPTQQSAPIALVANQKYYIEALHKEHEGADHFAVGWQLPGGTFERPVTGNRLSAYPGIANNAPLVAITSPVDNQSFLAQASITMAASASDSDGSIVKVEFFNGATRLGEDLTTPYAFSWNNVGAGSYALVAKATDNNGGVGTSQSVDIVVTAGESCAGGGSITHDLWTGIPGSKISSIPQDSEPTSTGTLTVFEAPQNTGNYYGRRIRGFICPPASGNYVFWISGNDRTELWLSTDGDPANKTRIAHTDGYTYVREWARYTTQQSAPIALVANQKYYIEALHKELEGSDHVAVGWKLPNGTLERPITGNRLSPYAGVANSPPLVEITSPFDKQIFSAPASVGITVSASDNEGSIAKVEFYNGKIRLGEDRTTPYAFTWNNVSPGSYSVVAKATDNVGEVGNASVDIIVTGAITHDVWANVPGSKISSIPLNTEPTTTNTLAIFEAPENTGNFYGRRIRGYIYPPASGNYVFWISGNDRTELWLSTDDNPANKRRIAYTDGYTYVREWGRYPTQQSAPVALVSNRKYYIEALHKELEGIDHVSVGWQLPGGTLERPVHGIRLLPFANVDGQAIARVGTQDGPSLAAESVSHESGIYIYPNPASAGTAELVLPEFENDLDHFQTRISIQGITGEIIYSANYESDGYVTHYTIPLIGLSPGVYLVNVNCNNKTFLRRLIIR